MRLFYSTNSSQGELCGSNGKSGGGGGGGRGTIGKAKRDLKERYDMGLLYSTNSTLCGG